MATLWAVSDLHFAVKANFARLDELTPPDPADWLIVAGDVAERIDLVLQVLETLAQRYEQVIWVPGNHELFSRSADPFKGRKRYEELVRGCRELGVLTPEDPFATFGGVSICPLFTLYDYSFRDPDLTVEQALELAYEKNIIMTDEIAIAPFVDVRAWCWDRLAYSTKRLSRITGPTILINHWPLVQEPTMKMRWAEIALWCGSRHTRTWPQRYNAQAVIYGHLHMPSVQVIDGVKHMEVSLGYPRDWKAGANSSKAEEIAFPHRVMDDEKHPPVAKPGSGETQC